MLQAWPALLKSRRLILLWKTSDHKQCCYGAAFSCAERRQKNPRRRQEFRKLCGSVSLFPPRELFSSQLKLYPSVMGMQPDVTSELNGTGLGYTSASWLSPHRDSQLLTPSEDL